MFIFTFLNTLGKIKRLSFLVQSQTRQCGEKMADNFSPAVLIESHSTRQGINTFDLPAATKICIKTLRSFYELELLGNSKGIILGGTMLDTSPRFNVPTNIIIHGATLGELFNPDWIEIGKRFQFMIAATGGCVSTSMVRYVIVKEPDVVVDKLLTRE